MKHHMTEYTHALKDQIKRQTIYNDDIIVYRDSIVLRICEIIETS